MKSYTGIFLVLRPHASYWATIKLIRPYLIDFMFHGSGESDFL